MQNIAKQVARQKVPVGRARRPFALLNALFQAPQIASAVLAVALVRKQFRGQA